MGTLNNGGFPVRSRPVARDSENRHFHNMFSIPGIIIVILMPCMLYVVPSLVISTHANTTDDNHTSMHAG